jgi:hypothetical protein
MDEDFQKKAQSQLISIIFVSFACVIMISIIPLVNESIPESSPDFDKFADIYIKKHAEMKENISMNLYLSVNSMNIRDNYYVNQLSVKANYIVALSWACLILGIISFIGFFMNSTQYYEKFSFYLLTIGCLVFIASILVLIVEYLFVSQVGSYDNISLAAVGSADAIVKYIYFFIFFNILLILTSISYLRSYLKIVNDIRK